MACALCSTGLLVAISIVTVLLVCMMLTYVGVSQYQKHYIHHTERINLELMTQQSCMSCQPFREGTWVCDSCTPSRTFSTLDNEIGVLTQQGTRVSVHEAVGFLWNWCGGITFPTILLSKWVFLLFNVSINWTLFSMACTGGWFAYVVIQWLMVRQIVSFTKTMDRANETPHPGFNEPSVAELILQPRDEEDQLQHLRALSVQYRQLPPGGGGNSDVWVETGSPAQRNYVTRRRPYQV